MNNSNKYKAVVILGLAGVFICLYAYFIPGAAGAAHAVHWPLFERFPGDLPSYLVRFTASALFLGISPIIALYVLERCRRGSDGADKRIGPPGRRRGFLSILFGPGKSGEERFFKWRPFWGLLVFCMVSGALGSFDSGLGSIYPYSKTLAMSGEGWGGFAIHALLYIVLFYLPWEIFFRGFLILPLLDGFFSARELEAPFSGGNTGLVVFVAMMQLIPSSLLHFGHPLSESLGAVVFGVIAGYLVLRFRSLWPPLILHAATGLSLDLAIRLGGVS